MSGKPRALIAGAGIGGLAAAVALESSGFDVTLFERAPSLRELGFGVLLAANAVRALRLLGVADAVIARAEVGQEGELRASDGRVLKHVRMDNIRNVVGEDAICVLRQVLHESLAGALQHAEIRTSARVTGFEQSEGGVEAILETGERAAGSLLVAADGLYSVVREKLHGDATRPSGLVAYRGVCRNASWDITGCQYFGRGVEAGVARAGQNSIYWYVCVKQSNAHSELEPQAAALAVVRAGLDAAVASLVERTAPSDVHRDTLVDRAPLPRWGERRVTLLGDAAHPMLPHAGQGAAQALEDAVVLGRCLSRATDLEAGLRRYEELRTPRTRQVVEVARRNARVGGVESRWLCALRDWLISKGPASMMERQLVSMANVDLERA